MLMTVEANHVGDNTNMGQWESTIILLYLSLDRSGIQSIIVVVKNKILSSINANISKKHFMLMTVEANHVGDNTNMGQWV